MKLPRDVTSEHLMRVLEGLGYKKTRQTGSHIRLTNPGPPPHSVTVPFTYCVHIKTLNSIISSVSVNLHKSKNEIIAML